MEVKATSWIFKTIAQEIVSSHIPSEGCLLKYDRFVPRDSKKQVPIRDPVEAGRDRKVVLLGGRHFL